MRARDNGKGKKERAFLLFSLSPSSVPHPTPRFLVYLQREPLLIAVEIKNFDYSQILALLPNIPGLLFHYETLTHHNGSVKIW